jgi:hypothetical protein
MAKQISRDTSNKLSAVATERRRPKNGQPVARGFESEPRPEAEGVTLMPEGVRAAASAPVRSGETSSETTIRDLSEILYGYVGTHSLAEIEQARDSATPTTLAHAAIRHAYGLAVFNDYSTDPGLRGLPKARAIAGRLIYRAQAWQAHAEAKEHARSVPPKSRGSEDLEDPRSELGRVRDIFLNRVADTNFGRRMLQADAASEYTHNPSSDRILLRRISDGRITQDSGPGFRYEEDYARPAHSKHS